MTRAVGVVSVCVLSWACVFVLTGCSAGRSVTVGVAAPAAAPLPEIGPAPIDRDDPWEGMNRHVYRFNANFDKYVFLPALEGWRAVLPTAVRRGFSNLLSHIELLRSLANSILQLDAEKSVGTVGRIVINSVFGVAGLFDAASGIGLVDYHEDFGQTLGVWGVGNGPYVVLPFLGPSSVRDTCGFVVDRAASAWTQVELFGTVVAGHPYIFIPEVLQARDDTPFRYGELGPFEYDLVRFFYLEWRQSQVQF